MGGEAAGPALACFAHPDDAEIAAGGTLAKWAAADREVHLLVLTNGDRGSADPATDRAELTRIRREETGNGAGMLGLASWRILDVPDGELESSPEVRAEIAQAIRRVRPTAVVSCDPTAWFLEDRYINHADHRTAGAATCDAVYPGAGNPHFFAEQLADGLGAWSVPEVWLAWTTEPNHCEDVTGFMERKLSALAEHRSQAEGGMLGYFEEWVTEEAEEVGRRIGVRHAEAFRVIRLD